MSNKKHNKMEEMLIKKIRGGLMGIKNKTKTPQDVAKYLNQLKSINPYLYADYLNDYKQTLNNLK